MNFKLREIITTKEENIQITNQRTCDFPVYQNLGIQATKWVIDVTWKPGIKTVCPL